MGGGVLVALPVVILLVITVCALAWRKRVARRNVEAPQDRYRREIGEIQDIRRRMTAPRGYRSGGSSTGVSDYGGGGYGGGGYGGSGGGGFGCGGHGC